MEVVDYLLTSSGFPEMKFMASAMIKGYTRGIDSEKEAGVLLYFSEDAQEPDFLAFVPVKDIDEMLDVVAQLAEVEEDEDYATIVTDQGIELMVKEEGGFAFISNKEEIFEELPESPTKLLGDLPAKYNFSARVFGQQIPAALRNQALDLIKESSQQTLENLDDELQAEVQEQNLAMQMKQMEMMFNESDTLTMGIKADQEAKNLVVEVEFTGVPNSELASKIASGAPKQKSRFTGFLMEGATFTQNQNFSISEDDAKEYSKMLEELKKTGISELDQDGDLSDEELEVVDKALTDVIDVIKETLSEGILDTGAVLLLDNGEINFGAGVHVASPDKIEATLKDLAAMAEEKVAGEIEVNLNSGSHKDITFHQFVFQVPDDEEEMRDALGDQAVVVVGIGNKAVYLGAGSNPVATLKKAIDGSRPVEDLMQYNVYVTPILKFVAGMEGDPSVEAMANALEESGSDRIRMTSNLIENGGIMRFEMQDGILGLIKVGFEAFSQGGGGFPGANDDF